MQQVGSDLIGLVVRREEHLFEIFVYRFVVSIYSFRNTLEIFESSSPCFYYIFIIFEETLFLLNA